MKQVGEYQITHPDIAKGAFASIHKGKHIYSDYIVAIKEIKLNGSTIKNYIRREIEIHRSLDHPNIVRVLDVIYDSSTSPLQQHTHHPQQPQQPQHPQQPYQTQQPYQPQHPQQPYQPYQTQHPQSVYIIMEYCNYGDLQKFQNKKPFSHKHIQNYMLQLRDALQYLRTRNIVHRDLKPQNILLSSPIHIKITDFGLARYINLETESELYALPPDHEDLFSTYCGSPIYMSPELLNHQQYNSKSDLWSLGIILYELITGMPPFIANNIKQLVNRVNTEKINFDKIYKIDKIDKTLISNDCINLLSNLLNHDKTRRLDWDEFFTHKWFSYNIILEEENRIIENPLCYDLIDSNNLRNIDSLKTSSLTNILLTNTPVLGNILLTNTPVLGNTQPTTHTNNTDPELIKSTSSSSSGLKFSDHLNINSNSPNPECRHISIDKNFTFSLKSSRISEELKLNNQHRTIIPSNSPESTNLFNLSDLVQDDIAIGASNTLLTNRPVLGNPPVLGNRAAVSKPINIIGRNNRYLRTPSSSESGSSTSTQSHINNSYGTSAPTRSIRNAIKFIKETYDYLSSDNKSL